MVAASLGWKEGCWELLRNDASLTAVDDKGHNAIQIAKDLKRKAVTLLFDEWTVGEHGLVSHLTRLNYSLNLAPYCSACPALPCTREQTLTNRNRRSGGQIRLESHRPRNRVK
jgi:hypothetical protein